MKLSYPLVAALMVLPCLDSATNTRAAETESAAVVSNLRQLLKDSHADGAEHWVYNDLSAALAEARKLNRPLFVTFRCVPCKACAGFDAEVAQGSELIRALAKSSFVSLRQVEMKGVDLSQFQFDYDLNWAAMFINADGTVYGRYGTQSAQGPDAYNSVASLEKAMQRVLRLHANYPANAASLAPKHGAPKPYATALEMPELENREKLRGPTARNNCVHCHNIHDAEQEHARKQGTFSREFLNRYPLPENVGLRLHRNDGCLVEAVMPDSPAAKAAVRPGDTITHVNGQPIISVADIQWVLHYLPNTNATLAVTVNRASKSSRHQLPLAPGWKTTDFNWRGSRWSLKPRPGFWAPALAEADARKLNLPPGTKPLQIKWINTEQTEGRAARKAGLKEGDVIIALDKEPFRFGPEEFHMHVRMNYAVGQKLALTILRQGVQQDIELPLVD